MILQSESQLDDKGSSVCISSYYRICDILV